MGEEFWSYIFGFKYVGYDGLEDGFLSMLMIVGDVVFVMSV